MLSADEVLLLMQDLESDRVERTISFKEDKLGPAACAFSNEEEQMLSERRSSLTKTFDTQPCFGSSISDLNTDLFKNFYLPRAIDTETLRQNNRDIKQQLASLRFYDLVNDCPTNAGVILFADRPTYYIPGAYIQYVKIPSKEIIPGIEFEIEFKKCLCLDLLNLDEFIQSVIIKKSLIQRPESLQEQIIYNYPLWSIRELVFNAVIHRNYESNAPILIYEFTDRIEIKNSGYLFGQVNRYNFPNLSDYRNMEIAESLKTLGYINKFNFGIATATKYLRDNNNPDPVFDLTLVTAMKVTIFISRNWRQT